MFTGKIAIFVYGALLGSAGLKILASKDARKLYTHLTAAGLLLDLLGGLPHAEMEGGHELRSPLGVLLHAQDPAHAPGHGVVDLEPGGSELHIRAAHLVSPLQAVLRGGADAARPCVQTAGGKELLAQGLAHSGRVREQVLQGHPRAFQASVGNVEAVELFLPGGIQGVLLRHVPRGRPGGLHVGGKDGLLIELVGLQKTGFWFLCDSENGMSFRNCAERLSVVTGRWG